MSIIAISGKKSSGKDTIGKMINFIIWKNKYYPNDDTVKFSNAWYPKASDGDNMFEIKKFAYKLKEICAILTGTKVQDFEDEEFKNKLLPIEWQLDNINDKEELKTYRWLLQYIGTNAMRNVIHKDIWVNALFSDYKIKIKEYNEEAVSSDDGYYNKKIYEEIHPNWLITDLRFHNELKAIKERNGLIIRVNRNSESKDNHLSETALDDYPFEIVIDNNGTIEELFEKVKEVLINNKII